jgi:hypothetical protein
MHAACVHAACKLFACTKLQPAHFSSHPPHACTQALNHSGASGLIEEILGLADLRALIEELDSAPAAAGLTHAAKRQHLPAVSYLVVPLANTAGGGSSGSPTDHRHQQQQAPAHIDFAYVRQLAERGAPTALEVASSGGSGGADSPRNPSSMIERLQDRVLLMEHTDTARLWHTQPSAAASAGGRQLEPLTARTPCAFLPGGESHEQYFRRRYGLQLRHLDAPLLPVRGGRGVDGMVLGPAAARAPPRGPVAGEGEEADEVEVGGADADPGGADDRRLAYLPLELCRVLPMPQSDWLQVQALPAIVFRLTTLLQQRGTAQTHADLLAVAAGVSDMRRGPPPLLRAALTAARAREPFGDQELLEFVGDVVLKTLSCLYLYRVGWVYVLQHILHPPHLSLLFSNRQLSAHPTQPSSSSYNPSQPRRTPRTTRASCRCPRPSSSETAPWLGAPWPPGCRTTSSWRRSRSRTGRRRPWQLLLRTGRSSRCVTGWRWSAIRYMHLPPPPARRPVT